ncbi:ABC transporter substrate-binding protein [Brachybacterium sp. NBEC-018]|uniref:ABC transporter substrate-binding protein n=1 Tax=Brachybacterium sp. NBEC-018 TaxID=2996004 RepID=UPI002174F57C|nr:ABC transporter substrate-binding protein [Brachybacterium sp. NBEC-018]UVY84072.1 ABC transporter substrate-binding protein [Brachybacterium sp. NBEC-018]
MHHLTRRRTLAGLGAAGLATLAAACGTSAPPTAEGSGGADGALRWWDHFGGLQDLHTRWAEEVGASIGVTVEHTYNEPSAATEALQLANQAGKLPDVYTALVGLPLPALVDSGWVHEITLSDEARARLPEGAFVEGLTQLDGKIYGLPAFSDKQYVGLAWYNTEVAEAVGFEPPTSYDDLIAALQAIADHGEHTPMTMALGVPGRMREQIDDLAQAGGFPGYQGQRYDTGEFEYHHDAYLAAIELYKEISDKGFLLPGSAGFQIPDARGRWAAGGIGFHMDGPYSPGAVRSLNPDMLPLMAVAGMPTPEGQDVVATRGARGADWVMAGSTQLAEQASQLIESFTQEDYQTALASGMDQPPILLDVVAKAEVIAPYAQLVGDFSTHVFRAPQAIVRNVEVAKAEARRSTVTPELGDVIQGYLGGEISDLKQALVDLSDASSRALDDAIAGAAAEGAAVDRTDWEFPDWEAGKDYAY